VEQASDLKNVKSVLKHVTLFSGLNPAPHVESVLKHVTLFSGLKPAPHVESVFLKIM
jgi:hypothetical protein